MYKVKNKNITTMLANFEWNEKSQIRKVDGQPL